MRVGGKGRAAEIRLRCALSKERANWLLRLNPQDCHRSLKGTVKSYDKSTGKGCALLVYAYESGLLLPVEISAAEVGQARFWIGLFAFGEPIFSALFPKPTIMKFGGTSVEDARAFERVRRIVRERAAEEERAGAVVVVSAMSRVTDALLESVQRAASGDADGALCNLDEHFARHQRVARELLSEEGRAGILSALEDFRKEIREHLRALGSHAAPRLGLQDEVVSYGERLSATLLASVLREGGLPARYMDARRLIITNDEHGQAAPIFEETECALRDSLGPLLERGETAVIGGFIGSCEDGRTTTLGRGGSDYTAAIAGACLDAREIQIWTDVNGVLTADPRLVRGARTVERLSYAEAAELAYFGAKVLHPKTIQPAIEQCIPVRICNSRAPEETGTLVGAETATAPRTVKAIAHKTDVTVVQITAARMLGAYGFLRALFEVFDRHRTVVDVVTTSEVSVSLTLDDASALSSIIRDLRDLGTVLVEPHRATICVVGEGLRDTPGIAAHIFNTISDINVSLISLGASSINLTFVIEEERLTEAVTRLHAAFFDEPRRQTSPQAKVMQTTSDTSI